MTHYAVIVVSVAMSARFHTGYVLATFKRASEAVCFLAMARKPWLSRGCELAIEKIEDEGGEGQLDLAA